jgi:CubicO group peptidase (beta-lactamase class C family)
MARWWGRVCAGWEGRRDEAADDWGPVSPGSDTKAMTATLMAVLVEEGKLKWTTTVGEFSGRR